MPGRGSGLPLAASAARSVSASAPAAGTSSSRAATVRSSPANSAGLNVIEPALTTSTFVRTSRLGSLESGGGAAGPCFLALAQVRAILVGQVDEWRECLRWSSTAFGPREHCWVLTRGLVLRLDCGDRDGVDDVLHQRAA